MFFCVTCVRQGAKLTLQVVDMLRHPVSGESIYDVIKSLQDDSINLFKWFLDHQGKANSSKCYLNTIKQNCMNLQIRSVNMDC